MHDFTAQQQSLYTHTHTSTRLSQWELGEELHNGARQLHINHVRFLKDCWYTRDLHSLGIKFPGPNFLTSTTPRWLNYDLV